ncbi:hypothetical protein IFM89_002943 [Coptis chinensis]|uniref:Uncharacterized protein n=1 Tax=Coptis chinensis TaxID=261450 RepID=A0A835ILU8_9MAGN|nr:hypothetical protein IFM89_002943 [Coptis chinensis]
MFSGTQEKCATCRKMAYPLEKVSATVLIQMNELCASFYLASGLVLSTDVKPRLKWMPELHERFIRVVKHLEGADNEGNTKDSYEAHWDSITYPIPPKEPFTNSTILGCAIFTAYGAMRHAADMRAGDAVAFIGIGGVGSRGNTKDSYEAHGDSRTCLIPSKEPFTGLVLSTDAKPRLKWTPKLHEGFIRAVKHLGGADKATPKTVMKLMGIPGLALYHLKIHLQIIVVDIQDNELHNGKMLEATHTVNGAKEDVVEKIKTKELKCIRSLEISESLEMQIEVQRRLNEHL